MTSFYFQGLRKCFLEISIRLEVLLAALFISVFNRYQKRLFICFSRLGKKVTKMCFSKEGILWRFVINICLIKRSTAVIWTQWQNFLQDPRKFFSARKLFNNVCRYFCRKWGVVRGSCKKFCHWVRITSVLRLSKWRMSLHKHTLKIERLLQNWNFAKTKTQWPLMDRWIG